MVFASNHGRQVADREGLEFAADGNHHGQSGRIDADRILDVQDALVIEIRQNGRAGGIAQRDRLVRGRRDNGAQGAPGTHDAIGMLNQGRNRQVHSFQSGGRPHDVAVIEREHDGIAGTWVKDPGETVFHAPLEMVEAFEKEAGFLDWDAKAVISGILVRIVICHSCF